MYPGKLQFQGNWISCFKFTGTNRSFRTSSCSFLKHREADTWVAMAFAVFLLSPVRSTTSIPMLCSVCTARAASCLTMSAIAIIPHNTPAQIKNIPCQRGLWEAKWHQENRALPPSHCGSLWNNTFWAILTLVPATFSLMVSSFYRLPVSVQTINTFDI